LLRSLVPELLFSWSNCATVSGRVRHLKMDSRGPLKSGHGDESVPVSVIRYRQMDAVPSLSRENFCENSSGSSQKFFDKFPRLKSLVIPARERFRVVLQCQCVNVCRYSRTFTLIRVMVRASPSFCKAWSCIMQYKVEAMRRNAKVHAHYRLFTLVCARAMSTIAHEAF
jgi:hypothetical protein